MTVASALKAEILRLSKKTVREQVDPLRAALTTQRRQIAELKRQITELEKQQRKFGKLKANRQKPEASEAPSGRKPRFTAEMVKKDRARLGLSQPQYAQLINVSPQSVYNYESATAVPRRVTLDAIASVRTIGKREAAKRLVTA